MDILFDLDGTILDVAGRYYFVHSAAAESCGGRPLPRPEYEKLRREGWEEKRIAEATGSDVAEHVRVWDRLIESPEALDKDLPAAGIMEGLEALKTRGRHRLFLVTLRRRPEGLERQVQKYGLGSYFVKIVSAGPKGDPAEFKAGIIKEAGIPPGSLYVGDTEVDARAAKILRTRFLAATYGLRGEEFLRKAGAREFARSPADILSLVMAAKP